MAFAVSLEPAKIFTSKILLLFSFTLQVTVKCVSSVGMNSEEIENSSYTVSSSFLKLLSIFNLIIPGIISCVNSKISFPSLVIS